MPASELPKIVFVGPRAAGKSSLAKLLAGRLGCDFHDTDALLAASVGCPAGDFLATKGEVAFRAAEQLVVRQALADPEVRVLALGGGAVLDQDVRDLLVSPGYFVVFLSAPMAVLVERQIDGSFRPPLTKQSLANEVETLFEIREPLYKAVSDLELDTNSLDVHRCQDAILVSMGVDGG